MLVFCYKFDLFCCLFWKKSPYFGYQKKFKGKKNHVPWTVINEYHTFPCDTHVINYGNSTTFNFKIKRFEHIFAGLG